MNKLTLNFWNRNGETVATQKVSAWPVPAEPEGGLYVHVYGDDDSDLHIGLRITEDQLREMGFVPAFERDADETFADDEPVAEPVAN